MKAPITRLFGLVVLLFAVLVGFTSYWSVFDAKALRDNPANHRDELQEQRIKRGTIRSQEGTLIAGSVRHHGGVYTRRYPQGDLFGHPVGYSYSSIGKSGLEAYYNDLLTGRRTGITTVFDTLLSHKQVGDDLQTTLNAKAQRVALDALRSSPTGKGAVVAMDIHSGAVRVMTSSPPYDPNNLDNPRVFRRLSTDNTNAPLVDRATQSLYPPGSTFKTVTAAAALDTGRYTPNSMISGRNNKVISGVPLQNFSGENFGDVTLTFGLTHSINTVFGEVGEKLGHGIMAKYMKRFGFDAQPPIDLPSTQLAESGEHGPRGIIPPTSRKVDVGRMAIGQDKLLVTPLQMATVAQTIANGGVRMKPFLVSRAFDSDGRTTLHRSPEQAARVMSGQTAAALTTMMQQVVKEGTGTAAALTGVQVAGKTGTAELNNNGLNDLWFIGFDKKVAVAAVVERVQGGQGGTVAAPIVKRVLEALG